MTADGSASDATAALATKTVKVASYIATGKIASTIIQAAMFIVIARLLMPSGYGIYTLALSIAAFISSFGNVSIGTYFNQHIPYLLSRKRLREISIAMGDGIVAIALPGIILTAAGGLASGLISGYVLHSQSYAGVVFLAISGIVFYLMYNSFTLILVSFNDGKNNAISNILYSMLQGVISISLVVLGFGILGYITALVIASLFQIIVTDRRFGISFIWRGMAHRMGEMLKFSMPLTYASIISTLVTNFSVILLGLVVLPSFVGQYGVASRVGTLVDFVAGTMTVVLIPMFAEAIHSKQLGPKVGRLFYYSIYFGLLFTAPMIAYITVLSRDFIITVFSASYSTAIIYMQLTAVGLLIGIFGSFATQLLTSMKETRKIFKYTAIVSVVELASLLVLVPLFHFAAPQDQILPGIGVILSMLYVGGIATNLLFMRYLQGRGISIKFGKIARVLAANVVLGVIVYAFGHLLAISPEIILVAGVALSLAIYPPIIAKLGAVTLDDVAVIKRIINGVPALGGALGFLLDYTSLFL